MSKTVHCFVSQKGDLLPRWQEAFPSASARRFEIEVSRGDTPQLTWVRLPTGVPVAQLLDTVRRNIGDMPVIALSDQPDDEEALACFAAAARGYCNTHALPELLLRVADVALHGGLWIGESLMQRLLQGTARIATPAPKGVSADWAALLTQREQQVAQAVAEGASNKEIARQLDITERTIKAHTGAIFEKLGVRDRLQLSLIVNGRQVR